MLKIGREPWVDAMRALALLGVFLINGIGYSFSPNYPLQLGPPQPIDSLAASATHGAIIFLIQGKAWSLLSFLFGYSLCAMALDFRNRGLDHVNKLQRRYVKLLLVGIFHGFFLYFGDILTTYGLCGLLASAWVLKRLSKLLKIWLRLSLLAVGIATFIICASIASHLFDDSAIGPRLDIESLRTFGNIRTVYAFFELNSTNYLWQQFDSLFFFLPSVLWCIVTGILARRFKLLSSTSRAKLFWSKTLTPPQCGLILVFNIGLGLASVAFHHIDGYSNRVWIIGALSGFFGIGLSAALIATVMRRIHKTGFTPTWMNWLAPAGRHTLAMYLLLSITLVLSNGAFLNLQAGTVATLACLVLAWLAAVLVATMATRRGLRDPVARWLSR
jgi:uncharacterized protein